MRSLTIDMTDGMTREKAIELVNTYFDQAHGRYTFGPAPAFNPDRLVVGLDVEPRITMDLPRRPALAGRVAARKNREHVLA